MKKRHIKISVPIVLTLMWLGLSWPAAAQNIKPAENNDFYDNVPFKELPFDSIEIAGEVTSPGRLSFERPATAPGYGSRSRFKWY